MPTALAPSIRWTPSRCCARRYSGMALFDRVTQFCDRFGLRIPILLAPMAGACPPSLSITVANAGGMGACGALLMMPEQIRQWTNELRAATDGPFQVNLWIP